MRVPQARDRGSCRRPPRSSGSSPRSPWSSATRAATSSSASHLGAITMLRVRERANDAMASRATPTTWWRPARGRAHHEQLGDGARAPRRNPPDCLKAPMYVVTGGAGFIGSNIVAGSPRAAADVVVVDWLRPMGAGATSPSTRSPIVIAPEALPAWLQRHARTVEAVHPHGRQQLDHRERRRSDLPPE